MKHPWQTWLIFCCSLVIVLGGLGWLTVKALELDQAERIGREQLELARKQQAQAYSEADHARRVAEQQEKVSEALWRMDTFLTPLIAQEAARPYFVYRPFITGNKLATGKGTKGQKDPSVQLIPSPLLVTPTEYVKIHFQLDEKEIWTSPQIPPTVILCDQAKTFGATDSSIVRSSELLSQLSVCASYPKLMLECPTEDMPSIDLTQLEAINTMLNGKRGPWVGPMQSLGNFNNFNNSANRPAQTAQAAGQQRSQAGQGQAAAVPQAPPVQSEETQQEANADGLAQDDSGQQQKQTVINQLSQGPQYRNSRRQNVDNNQSSLQQRNRGVQAYAQSELLAQRFWAVDLPVERAMEGVSRAFWVEDKLLFARRVEVGGKTLIQGCWLNWGKLKAQLSQEVIDLFPDAQLKPVLDPLENDNAQALVTLPVRLEVDEPKMRDLSQATEVYAGTTGWSVIQLSLVIAWCCLMFALVAAGVLLQGVLKLSERRAAFVSAVTHELRTPLTTFRMYAEMLVSGMVPSSERRRQYLETLRLEADRLSHLVENVLQYARLERTNKGRRREVVQVSDLVDRMERRMADRAKQADVRLKIECDEAVGTQRVNTDPSAVEQILFNLVDNACKYAACEPHANVIWRWRVSDGQLHIEVEDHGPGIDVAGAKKLFKPFSKSVHDAADTAPGVGLGLALSRRLAQALDGQLTLRQSVPQGATFTLALPLV